MEDLAGKKIAVLLSGGVDSSVVVYELVRQGLKPDCFYIRIGQEPTETEDWDCSAEEDIEMATAIASRYKLNLEIIDCHKEYWDEVTTYTMDKVKNGFTPNPDVMCNKLIKFGAFDKKKGFEYDIIATGHYAQTEIDDEGRKWLCTSPDPVKDQTDFLCQIEPWQLKKAIFPIGGMMKETIRAIAEREHLVNAKRKDSQGICFLGKINYNDYVRRFLGENPGTVIELETGRKLGQHRGLWFHTIGQRKGLGFGEGPWFAIKKDIEKNILFVSKGYNPSTAYKDEFLIHDLHLLTPGAFPKNEKGVISLPKNISVKIRHTPVFTEAEITPVSSTTYKIKVEKPIHGVAPGQFCTIYDTSHHRCFGSAEITL